MRNTTVLLLQAAILCTTCCADSSASPPPPAVSPGRPVASLVAIPPATGSRLEEPSQAERGSEPEPVPEPPSWQARIARRYSPEEAALRVGLIRQFAADDFARHGEDPDHAGFADFGVALESVRTFPLTGDRLAGRAFWAVVGRTGYRNQVAVYEVLADRMVRRARYDSWQDWLTADPVAIEPAHAWIVGRGGSGARGSSGWEILRFDGESLHVEVEAGWQEAEFVDVDDDGRLEIVGRSVYHVHCYYCGLAAVAFDLHRWNGTRMVHTPLERLPAGAASDEAVAANNRAVLLGGAGRWAEAAGVVGDARPLVAEHAVFRRNAALIDLYAGPGSEGLSGERLLGYVLAGRWSEAVDIFRHGSVLPDFFADPPPYPQENGYGSPPFLLAVFNATAKARRVAPARPEIEFLHAWAAFHLDPDTTTLDRERDWWPNSYAEHIDSDDSVVLDALDRAVRLAPGDPLFAEAQRLVARRAHVTWADAMRRTFLLFDTAAPLRPGLDAAPPEPRPEAATTRSTTGALAWTPWRPARRPLAATALQADLIRRFAATSLDDEERVDAVSAFPLANGGPAAPSLWAAFHPAADRCRIARRAGMETRFECTAPVLVIYARRDGVWREVAHHAVYNPSGWDGFLTDFFVAPVEVEPSHEWIEVRGVRRDGTARWRLLRFDGTSVREESAGDWREVMIADIDRDGAREVLRRDALPLCYDCGVTRRVVRVYRWTGTRLARVPLELLAIGAASDAAVAANNRAVTLARAGRWAEAAAVLAAARPLLPESAVFRRNAGLIDLNGAAPAGEALSEDPLLGAVFGGRWAEAVGHFRTAPVGPDVFTAAPPFPASSLQAMRRYGAGPLLRAVFDATAAARAVAPARPEIEFLHAWAVFHLDADLGGPARPADPSEAVDWFADYRVDADLDAVLETLDRAVALAPDDALYADARRAVAERSGRGP